MMVAQIDTSQIQEVKNLNIHIEQRHPNRIQDRNLKDKNVVEEGLRKEVGSESEAMMATMDVIEVESEEIKTILIVGSMQLEQVGVTQNPILNMLLELVKMVTVVVVRLELEKMTIAVMAMAIKLLEMIRKEIIDKRSELVEMTIVVVAGLELARKTTVVVAMVLGRRKMMLKEVDMA